MGRKRSWPRKHILLYIACLIFFIPAGCGSLYRMHGVTPYSRLHRDHLLMKDGNFETILKEDQELLARFGAKPPADSALFGLGLVYAHQANPEKDYQTSLNYFKKLVHDFPASPLSEEAKIWIGIIEESKIAEPRRQDVPEEKDNQKELIPLQIGHDLMKQGDFEEILKKNQDLLTQAAGKPPADIALFNLGLIYAHYANPKKDYKKSAMFLKRLADEYPTSPLAEEARIWLGVFEVIEKIQQVDIEIEEKKKEFTQ